MLVLGLTACGSTPSTRFSTSAVEREGDRHASRRGGTGEARGRAQETRKDSQAAPIELVPPRPGLYRYRIRGKASTGEDLRVYRPKRDGSRWIQRSEWVPAGGDGTGDVIAVTHSWSGRDVRLLRSVKRRAGKGAACTYRPPVTELRVPLSPRAKWSNAWSCGGSETLEFVVLRDEELDVAGKRVHAFAIRATSTRDRTVTQRVEWFAPAYGLSVRFLYERSGSWEGTLVELTNLEPDRI